MDPVSVIIFIILFLLSAFFSGSEIALMTIPEHKIDAFIKQKKKGAKTLKSIKSNNDRLLITILIGNNLVNVITASFATQITIQIASNSGIDASLAIGISTGIITLLLLMFGEIFPKTFASRYSDQISLYFARIYQILQYILYPIVLSIEFIMNKINTKKQINKLTDEEIKSFIEYGYVSGVFETHEYEKIKNMLTFNEVTTEEIMTPRVKIESLNINMSVEDAIKKTFEYTHSRIPVFGESIDDTEYIITIRELIKSYYNGNGHKKLSDIKLNSIIKIPINTPIYKVLEIFRKQRKHIAIAIDEYGGVAGIITLEDIMEEVFGEFQDESDNETQSIVLEKDGIIAQSYVRLEELLEKFQIDFEDIGLSKEEFEGETISYFITSKLERFPRKNEEIIIPISNNTNNKKQKKLVFKILDIKKNVIGEIKTKII